jgi:hypothetical protein
MVKVWRNNEESKMKVLELFEDQTIPQLKQSIERGFPDTKKRQHAVGEVRVVDNRYTPFTSASVLRVDSHVASNSGRRYNQFVDLENVSYDLHSAEGNVPVSATDHHEYYIKPVELNTTNVKVFCNCKDYQMRFAFYNIQNNCHIGPPPKQYSKVAGSDRGPVNPLKVPGLCKHLIKVVNILKQDGIVY